MALGGSDQQVVVDIIDREDADGFWIDVNLNKHPWDRLGPFETEASRDRAKADLLAMMKSVRPQ